MDLNIEHTKIELIQWLSMLDDVSTIEKLVELRESESADQWKKLSTAEKTSIQKGIEDADAGKLKDHSEAQKIYGKWL